MQIKNKLLSVYNGWQKKFEEQFEFKVQDVCFEKIVIYMNKPKDSSSLAVTRILFGEFKFLLMLKQPLVKSIK